MVPGTCVGAMEDKANLLRTLQRELQYLDEGGYDTSILGQWRPPLVFEDSPTCLCKAHPDPSCEECALLEFVPAENRQKAVPCRYIPLDGKSVTLDGLYRWGTHSEMIAAVRAWLTNAISSIERELESA